MSEAAGRVRRDRSTERVRTDPRISRRRRAVARTRRRRLLTRLSLMVGTAALVWLAFFSPLLAVREVKLSGAEHTRPADVENAAGLDSSDNLLLVSTSEIVERMKTLPWVESATVDRKLPGTVKVSVTERKPSAWLAVGDEHFTLDDRARVLAAGAVGKGLPILAGLQMEPPEPGDRLESPELRGALDALGALPKRMRADVSAVFAPTVERITFQMSDGVQVRYGAAEDMGSKNEVLAGLLRRLRGEGKTAFYVDVRVPEVPAVGPLPVAGPPVDDTAP
jgi:cell division protein FtsQ